ncbi:MAG TPA: hypothetical protein VN428_13750, partial [Bryobacteraceae bacterium]|nr:hypothetical protein [Bryobacteraceae bacterium]
MDYLISPTKAQSLLGALSGSEEAEVVCEVKCKRARKDKTLYKPVIKIPRRKKGAEAARLPVTFTSSPAGFPGPAKIAGPNGTVKLYQAAKNGVPITDFDVKVASPLMLYGEGAAAGATTLSLTLEGPNTTGVAEGEVVSEKINVVKPKIEAEYKLVLLEKNLSHHLAKGETKIYADATYIQVSIEESDASKHPYKKNAKLTCSPANAELFLDEKCTKAFDGTLTNKQLTNSAELY